MLEIDIRLFYIRILFDPYPITPVYNDQWYQNVDYSTQDAKEVGCCEKSGPVFCLAVFNENCDERHD